MTSKYFPIFIWYLACNEPQYLFLNYMYIPYIFNLGYFLGVHKYTR
jgi:hypothetical protein